MNRSMLTLVDQDNDVRDVRQRQPIGRRLVEQGALRTEDLVRALEMQRRVPARLGEILVSEGWSSENDIATALASQQNLPFVDLDAAPPDLTLLQFRTARFWARHQVLPWGRVNGALAIATARPDRIGDVGAALGRDVTIAPVLATQSQLSRHIAQHLRDSLAAEALTRVAPEFSCRTWRTARYWQCLPLSCGLAILGLLLVAPHYVVAVLSWLAVITLFMIASLKLIGLTSYAFAPPAKPAPQQPSQDGPPPISPRISVLVPLYREAAIADHLILRLIDLTYPKAQLQVLLVLEEHDDITRRALEQIELPPWIQILTTPKYGPLTTKPRAMNYALEFCTGDIVGVWDAEDAPAPDQLERVAAHFARAAPNVACVQGILDFYNPRTNWLARCFTVEYASWFRVILPGIARLGLVVPLGGTTMFVRRAALERIGAWDAHNVTEDADLGVRLARFGYVTDMIETVTGEEANFRFWPWVKQRSRWLKGFMVTYLVHMKRPGRLVRDLGWMRFLGVQAFFFGTVSQFLLAPVLWSFWLILGGFEHPAGLLLPNGSLAPFLAVLLLSGAINVVTGLVAVRGPEHRHLMGWAPTLGLYFPIGAIAAYKALWELACAPYYWDKTQHGLHRPPRKRRVRLFRGAG